MPAEGWFERELMEISQTVSDSVERRRQISALQDRRDRERAQEILDKLDTTSDQLDRVATALLDDKDSGTKTREEMETLREEMETLREEMARLTLILTARREASSGEYPQALPDGAVETIPERRPATPGAVPGWVVKALLTLLALSLAVVGGVVGLKIVGPWSSFSVEPASSDSGEPSSTPSSPVKEEESAIVWP
jgi:hypothetical protein